MRRMGSGIDKGMLTGQYGLKRTALQQSSQQVQSLTQKCPEGRGSQQPTPQHQPWEYDNYIGDVMQDKPEGVIQIYSQNINGISTKETEEDFQERLLYMRDRKVDVIGWSETNIEWNDYRLRQTLYKELKRNVPGA